MSQRVPLLALLIVGLAVLATAAQQPDRRFGRRGGRGGGGRFSGENSIVRLVEMRDVQRELQLNEDQQQLIYNLLSDRRDQISRAVQAVAADITPIRPDESIQRAMRRQVEQQARSISGKAEQIVAVILDAQQMERLQQIRLQQEGVRALDRQDFRIQLELSPAQIKKIRELRQAPGSSDNGRLSREVPPEVLAVLSPQQQQLWEQLKGPEFRFQRRGRFGRRGRPALDK